MTLTVFTVENFKFKSLKLLYVYKTVLTVVCSFILCIKAIQTLKAKEQDFDLTVSEFHLQGREAETMSNWKKDVQDFARGW